MKRRRDVAAVLALFVLFTAQSVAEDAAPTLARIRAEAQSGSQVVEYAQYLCDVVGPRLTGSPQLRSAVEWAAGDSKPGA